MGTPTQMSAAPPADAFPAWPGGWHLFGRSEELDARPVSRDLFGGRVVCWRAGGRLAAMDARCWHLGADLGGGDVAGGCLRCPFHHWSYDADGRCVAPRAAGDARQRRHAVAERAGFVFVGPNAEPPPFDPPFFEGVDPRSLVAAEPFELDVACPWYLVGANGFDVQHFRVAHDRTLVAEPVVDAPSPHARRIVARFAVAGTDVYERLTRLAAGPAVEMSVTDWCGSLVFVRARFARTTSYGMVAIRPLDAGHTRVQFTIFAARGMPLLDGARARIKRRFIRRFLEPDVARLAGARYDPRHLVPADAEMIGYFRWLADAATAAGRTA